MKIYTEAWSCPVCGKPWEIQGDPRLICDHCYMEASRARNMRRIEAMEVGEVKEVTPESDSGKVA